MRGAPHISENAQTRAGCIQMDASENDPVERREGGEVKSQEKMGSKAQGEEMILERDDSSMG